MRNNWDSETVQEMERLRAALAEAERERERILREATQDRNKLADSRDAALARAEAAAKKAEQYERDWYAAKSEFGDAMAKMREQVRAAEAALRASRERCDRSEALLTLYRMKAAADGLNGRPWNASVHLAAVQALAAVGEAIPVLEGFEDFAEAQETVESAYERLRALAPPPAAPGGGEGGQP